MEEERIEESSERLRSGLTRWVDGSEVDSETTPWSMIDESQSGEAYGSFRRVKKARRVDSFDVEAMEIAGSHGHHSKMELEGSYCGDEIDFGIMCFCEERAPLCKSKSNANPGPEILWVFQLHERRTLQFFLLV
ncbi:hypothetical protein Vadar_001997 [Vaccinium darrowii]|uniref:Uncharacterized protein n=1 Tax=Vaccinium darrowii TaxID=229202 RepID=A0ACB7Z9D9_9ERIC|nr:hypothetical protein Vadar_001997 [Vaccinium darrowii]